MTSIRRRLLLGTGVAMLIVGLASVVAFDRLLRSTLMNDFDRSLERDARFFASIVEVNLDGIDHGFDELDLREFEEAQPPAWLDVYYADGAPYFSTTFAPPPRPASEWRESRVFRTAEPEEGRYRIVDLSFRPRTEIDDDEENPEGLTEADLERPPMTLSLGRPTTSVDTLVTRLRLILVVVAVGASALAGITLAAVVRRGLRPLNRLATSIGRLDVDEPSAHVSLPDAPDEIRPVVRRLNEMLERVRAAFRRERIFTADVAHELRTPLAGIRSLIEVELSQPRDAVEYRRSLEDSLEIVVSLQRLVERLLELGRLESGDVRLHSVDVDLGAVVRACLEALEGERSAKRARVDRRIAEVVVRSDATLLHSAVRNVLENAFSHVEPGGVVRVELSAAEAGARLIVCNSGSRVSPSQVSGLFDRFSRLDDARSETGVHYGLGLPLLARIADTLGLSVDVATEHGGEFRVVVDVPAEIAAEDGRVVTN